MLRRTLSLCKDSERANIQLNIRWTSIIKHLRQHMKLLNRAKETQQILDGEEKFNFLHWDWDIIVYTVAQLNQREINDVLWHMK